MKSTFMSTQSSPQCSWVFCFSLSSAIYYISLLTGITQSSKLE